MRVILNAMRIRTNLSLSAVRIVMFPSNKARGSRLFSARFLTMSVICSSSTMLTRLASTRLKFAPSLAALNNEVCHEIMMTL